MNKYIIKVNGNVNLSKLDAFRSMRTDSLGLDTVVYFPYTEYLDREDDLEDEE